MIEARLEDLDQRKLYFYEQLEPSTTALFCALLAEDDVAIDVGANIGYYSLLASMRVGPRGLVISFEPDPGTADQLRHNLSRNGISNTIVYETAAGDEIGELILYRGSASGQTTVVEPNENESKERFVVPQTTLDHVTADRALREVRLLKIDVEGAEYHVLRGGIHFLNSTRPEVLIEVTPSFLKGAHSSVDELFNLMASLGYVGYEVREHESRLVKVDAASVSSGRNVYFSTREPAHVDNLNAALATKSLSTTRSRARAPLTRSRTISDATGGPIPEP